MKKMLGVLLVGVLALFMASGCASLKKITGQDTTIVPVEKIEIAEAPVSATVSVPKTLVYEKIAKSTQDEEWDSDIEIRQFGEDHIMIAVPIFKSPESSWQIYASIGWTDGEKWNIIPMESYVWSTDVKSGWAISRINLPSKGIGWYWIRAWGWDGQQWLIINTKSKYNRADSNGNPGYEFLVNPALQKIQPVSEEYNTRK